MPTRLARGVDHPVHWQVAVEVAADLDEQLGRLLQVLGMPFLYRGGEDMERPHWPAVDDTFK